MKVSEEFRKEAMGTHYALAFASVLILVFIAVSLIYGEIRGIALFPLLGFFVVILVHCYSHDKKTYREIQEEETKEETGRQKQLSK